MCDNKSFIDAKQCKHNAISRITKSRPDIASVDVPGGNLEESVNVVSGVII